MGTFKPLQRKNQFTSIPAAPTYPSLRPSRSVISQPMPVSEQAHPLKQEQHVAGFGHSFERIPILPQASSRIQRELSTSYPWQKAMSREDTASAEVIFQSAQTEERSPDGDEESPERITSESLNWSTGENKSEDMGHENRFDGGNLPFRGLKIKAKITMSPTTTYAGPTRKQAACLPRADLKIKPEIGSHTANTEGKQALAYGTFGSTMPTHTTELTQEPKQNGEEIELKAIHNHAIDITVQPGDQNTVDAADSDVVKGIVKDSPVPAPANLVARQALETWMDVYKDLYPNSYGKPCRSVYWSLKILKAHEKEHRKDSILATMRGIDQATKWLNEQTIPTGKWAKKRRQAKVLIKQANQIIRNTDLDDYYGSQSRTTAHDDRAGERRAYMAGKNQYFALANGIKARAKRENWEGTVTLEDVKAHHEAHQHPL